MLAAVTYPFVVLLALQLGSARAVAAAIALVALLRFVAGPRKHSLRRLRPLVTPVLAVGAVLLGAALTDDERYVLFLPVAINAALFSSFAATLLGPGPTMIESFATLQVGELTAPERPYCRRVTMLWCAFFVANGAIAAALALAGSREAWAAYNGLGAYGAMGLLFAGERWVRARRFPWRFDGSLPPGESP